MHDIAGIGSAPHDNEMPLFGALYHKPHTVNRVLMPELALYSSHIAGFLDNMFAHGMTGRMRGSVSLSLSK
jgi:hypothetical protein